MEVSVLANIVARDIRTTTESNLALIMEVTVLEPWSCSSGQVRKVLGKVESEVPAQDQWRIAYLEKLLAQAKTVRHYQLKDTSELTH